MASLSTLITENPFRVLGLPPDADARALRRRADELKMEARLGGESAAAAGAVAASRALERLEDRPLFELLAPWAGSPAYGTFAAVHDQALAVTAAIVQSSKVPGKAALDAIGLWGALAREPGLMELLAQRRASLGLAIVSGSAGSIAADVVAPLLRHMMTVSPYSAPSYARAVKQLDVDADGLTACEDAILSALKPLLRPISDSPSNLSAEVQAAETCLVTRGILGSVDASFEDLLLDFANGAAVRAFNGGDMRGAERVLLAGVSAGLPPETTAQMQRDLRTVRYHLAWAAANSAVSNQALDACVSALREARQFAQTPEQIRETDAALASVRRNTGVQGAARKVWASIGSLVSLAIVFAGIGWATSLCDSDESGAASTSTSLGSSSSSASSEFVATLAATAFPRQSFSTYINKDLDAYFSQSNNSDLDATDYTSARRNRVAFADAASRAVSLARSATARITAYSGSDERECQQALLNVMRTAAAYWGALEEGVRLASVPRWNDGVDMQSTYNRQLSAAEAACP